MSTPAATTDRAAALRAAVRRVVAERGLHGASMSRIAAEAGVASGTAYVHFADKDDLVLAAYVEAKRSLGAAATATAAALPDDADHRTRFVTLWLAAHEHLRNRPQDARFLVQVDASPVAPAAHARVIEDGSDGLAEQVSATGLREVLVDLDDELLYELALAPAVRLAARERTLDAATLRTIATRLYRAVATDG